MVGQVPTIGQIKTWKWCLTQKATSNRSIKSKACNVFFVYCNLLFWHVLAWGEQVSKSVLRRVAMFAIDIFKSSRLISNGCASSIVYQLINSICVCVRAYMRILYTLYIQFWHLFVVKATLGRRDRKLPCKALWSTRNIGPSKMGVTVLLLGRIPLRLCLFQLFRSWRNVFGVVSCHDVVEGGGGFIEGMEGPGRFFGNECTVHDWNKWVLPHTFTSIGISFIRVHGWVEVSGWTKSAPND